MNNNKFDEKQILERGKAYRNAFYTTLVLVASFGLFGFFYDGEISSAITTSTLFAILFVSATVFACTAIRLHAYERPRDDTRITSVFNIILIIVALLLIALRLYFGIGSDDREMGLGIIQVSMAISYLVIGIFYIIQSRIDNNKEKAENADDFTKNS